MLLPPLIYGIEPQVEAGKVTHELIEMDSVEA